MSGLRTLPSNPQAEKFILGSIMTENGFWDDVAILGVEDFSIESHRIIFSRMKCLYEKGEKIDRVTVCSELERFGQRDSVGGFSFVSSLDDGLPLLPNIDAYVRIVQECAVLRKAILAAQSLIDRCLDADPSLEILAQAEKTLGALADGQQKHGQWMLPGQVIEAFPGGMNAFLAPPRGGTGIPTPWPGLTEVLSGLHPGELFVIAGRPSMGKTVASMQMCHHAAMHGHGAAVFSLEMSKESLVQRMVCCVSRVDSHKLRAGYLSADERRKAAVAVHEIASIPLWIDDTRARTIPAISAALRKLSAKQSIEIVAIDHLQLLCGKRNQNRNQELTDIVHDLKHEAGKLNLTILLLSQLNRECEKENRRPQLSDLKETGTVEEDADVVMFVHRPERYIKNRSREDLRGVAEFIVAKQRSGPIGKKDLIFLDSIQRFESRAEDFGGFEEGGWEQ